MCEGKGKMRRVPTFEGLALRNCCSLTVEIPCSLSKTVKHAHVDKASFVDLVLGVQRRQRIYLFRKRRDEQKKWFEIVFGNRSANPLYYYFLRKCGLAVG
jgi:hypothetical protein